MTAIIHRSGIVDGRRIYETPLGRPLPETATDLEYMISWDGGGWMPGIYESESAAIFAGGLPDAVLHDLQENVNPGGIITLEMLHHAMEDL